MYKIGFTSLAVCTALLVGCGEEKQTQTQTNTPKVENTQVQKQEVPVQPAPPAPPAPPAQKEIAQISKDTIQQVESAASTFDPTIKYKTCATCHGAKGEGLGNFPKLAGQSASDLSKKISGYKDGTFGNERKALMIPQVKNLDEKSIEALSTYIASF